MFKEIRSVIQKLKPEGISEKRKAVLQPLVDFIQKNVDYKQANIRLHFICTHNSRRSHLSQVWAQALAYHFNINNIVCYSGGTETTAVYPMVIETLEESGFQV